MNDVLISKSALLENIKKSRKAHASVRSRLTVGDMEQMINGARPVDAEVVRHGRWEDNGIPESMLSKCSECGILHGAYAFNYCPNCGAKMDAEVEG